MFIASDNIHVVSATHTCIWVRYHAKDERVLSLVTRIASATHLQTQYYTADEHGLCWIQTLLAMEMKAFHAGAERFCAGDERIENVHLNFSRTQS